MRPEILLALASMVCLGLTDFTYRWGQRRGPAHHRFMLVQACALLPTLLAITLFRGELVWNPGLWLGVLNGVTSSLGFVFTLRALGQGEAVALVPIVRLNFAVTAVLVVVFLGEELDAARLAALLFAALAIALCGVGLPGARPPRRALLAALAAMSLFGLSGLLFKLGINVGATATALATAHALGFLATAVAVSIAPGRARARTGGSPWTPVMSGVLLAAFYTSVITAFAHGDALVVAPIAQLSFVLTAALAVVFLGERASWPKLLGIVSAAASIATFTLS